MCVAALLPDIAKGSMYAPAPIQMLLYLIPYIEVRYGLIRAHGLRLRQSMIFGSASLKHGATAGCRAPHTVLSGESQMASRGQVAQSGLRAWQTFLPNQIIW